MDQTSRAKAQLPYAKRTHTIHVVDLLLLWDAMTKWLDTVGKAATTRYSILPVYLPSVPGLEYQMNR